MPPKRKRKTARNTYWISNKSAKTSAFSRAGRPLRKPGHGDDSFVDSSMAIGDMSSDEESALSDEEENIIVKPRRKLSHTPEPLRKAPEQIALPPCSDDEFRERSSDDNTEAERHGSRSCRVSMSQPLQITLKVPKGPARDITLNIAPTNLISTANKTSIQSSLSKTSQDSRLAVAKAKAATSVRKVGKNVVRNAGLIGRLPRELRDKTYVLLFQSRHAINFGHPGPAFQRSAALLRTCRLIYEEGLCRRRLILYGRNQFHISNSIRSCGSMWSNEWSELDYTPARVFMKLIGPHNIALLRNVKLEVCDLQRAGHRALSTEERLAVNNETLLSVMRDLARYSELRTFAVELRTRRHVNRADSRFVDILTRIKTDELKLDDWANTSMYYRNAASAPPLPMFAKELIAYCTKKMVRKMSLHPETTDHWEHGMLTTCTVRDAKM